MSKSEAGREQEHVKHGNLLVRFLQSDAELEVAAPEKSVGPAWRGHLARARAVIKKRPDLQ